MSRTDASRPAGSPANLWLHLLLTAVSLGMVLPFVWMVLTSLKTLTTSAQ